MFCPQHVFYEQTVYLSSSLCTLSALGFYFILFLEFFKKLESFSSIQFVGDIQDLHFYMLFKISAKFKTNLVCSISTYDKKLIFDNAKPWGQCYLGLRYSFTHTLI